MTTVLLYGLIVAAVLAFIGLFFGIGWAYDRLMDRYQARRKHVLHTTAADERIVPRTGPPTAGQAAASKAAREARYGELREIPEPGKDYISDQNVRLPRTPSAAEWDEREAERWAADLVLRLAEGDRSPVVADITDARASRLSEPEDWAESTFVQALLALPLDRVHLAFDGVRQ